MKSFIIIIVLLISSPAISAISFTNGKWETTFSCVDWEQGDSLSCDQLDAGGGWVCGDEVGSAIKKDIITGDANNPAGGGGYGFRHWKGDGWYVDAAYNDDDGGGLVVTFPSPQKELWIRWYMRYQPGFDWLSLDFDKMLYIYTGGAGFSVVPIHYGWGEIVAGAQATTMPDGTGYGSYQVRTGNYGWNQVQGGASPGANTDLGITGSGEWVAYELYLKMDTNMHDGVGRIWINGVLRAENKGVNWSNNLPIVQQGWTWFTIGSNQREPDNNACAYVDYDDIAVYNQTPQKTDVNGNAFVGPIGWTGEPSGSTSAWLTSDGSILTSGGVVLTPVQ